MSLTSRRNGIGRVYVRRFDHEEALARLNAGESATALAVEYGVTPEAVRKIRTKAANLERQRAWRSGVCEMCGGPAMRLVGDKKDHNPDGRCVCKSCRGVLRRKRAADGVLECGHCHVAKPLAEFPPGVRRRVAAGAALRKSHCRACETKARQDYRERHKVPCERCGEPCLPPDEKGRRRADRALCRACYRNEFSERRRNGKAARQS